MQEFKNCPLCNNSGLKKIYQKKWQNSSFVRCHGCNLVFQNPQESITVTKSRYNNDYFIYEVNNQHNFFNLVEKTLNDFKIFDLIPDNSNILEVGSATGLFLKFMKEKGHNATGIEICEESVSYGKKNYGVNLINTTLEEANFQQNSFDFIHFSHLIEHLNNPQDFLKTIYKILKIGGYAMITTPNSKGLFSNIFNENWRCIVSDHLFLFDKNNLKKMLLETYFKIVGMKTWGGIPAGYKFKFIKKFFDKFVKIFAMGDVVCYLVKK
ncbi:MAG TPA: class I SAM-dependent methyltransferase [Spirochaetota bacterium]|nr:class I SAM-dependent methyltransferase [Spirochaetota bacterium]